MANELAVANETNGKNPNFIDKSLNLSMKQTKNNAFGGPNHFQSSFSIQKNLGVFGENLIDVSLDAVSMSGSYVAKSKLQRARSQGHTKRGNKKAVFYGHFSHNLEGEEQQEKTPVDSNIKVYIPKEYFKHAGYISKEELTEDARSRPSIKSNR